MSDSKASTTQNVFYKGDKVVNLIFGSHRTHSNHLSSNFSTKALPQITLEENEPFSHVELQPLAAKLIN